MRDDRAKWPPSGILGDGFDIGGVSLARVQLDRQVLVSGPRILTQVDMPIVEWPQICDAKTYALSLRRDRVLVVNGDAPTEGWNEAASQAVSDVSDLYAVFDLSGSNAINVLKRGTEISLNTPSKSVVRRYFGLQVMLYRVHAQDQFRLHIGRAYEDGLLGYLKSAAESAKGG